MALCPLLGLSFLGLSPASHTVYLFPLILKANGSTTMTCRSLFRLSDPTRCSQFLISFKSHPPTGRRPDIQACVPSQADPYIHSGQRDIMENSLQALPFLPPPPLCFFSDLRCSASVPSHFPLPNLPRWTLSPVTTLFFPRVSPVRKCAFLIVPCFKPARLHLLSLSFFQLPPPKKEAPVLPFLSYSVAHRVIEATDI